MRKLSLQPALWAAVSAGVVFAWQALTVNANYGGDWSALFCTGSWIRNSAVLDREGTYRFAGDPGYDGQYYHLIAHDPFLRGNESASVDNPPLRWRRILVPFLAWAFALGDPDYIDSTYAATILGFIALGAYWTAAYCRAAGVWPGLGLLFPLVPAALVSFDRFTVDVALAALCAGFAVERGWRLLLILALAPLARETGIVLPLGFVAWAALKRDWREAAQGILTLVPYAVWLAYVNSHTSPDRTVFASWIPFYGVWERTLHPLPPVSATDWLRTAAVLDYIALWGIWTAVAFVAWMAVRRERSRVAVASYLFTIAFVGFVSQPQVWEGAYSFARTMTPVLLLLALAGIGRKSWVYTAPLALTVPRLLFQLQPQWKGILASWL